MVIERIPGHTALAQSPRQVDLQTVGVVRHLLWHKAMGDHDDDGERINDFIRMVEGSEGGEHVSMRDPFHRDLAIAFELVIQEHLDPWDMDLSRFAELYLKEARERGVDLVTAGRILLMAWTVLKLQSDEIAERAQRVEEEPEELTWDDLPDWGMEEDEWDFTERIQSMPVAPIDEKIRHKGDRKVTLMELIGAFEEIHQEAEERQKLQQTKLNARLSLKRKMRGRVGGMMHAEDLEAEIAETWHRILEYPTIPIPFSDLVEPIPMDIVQTFNALLFLIKQGKVEANQENFPYGEIWITPVLAEAETVLLEAVAE